MSTAHNLSTNPIHLGLGATADIEPVFTGEMSWYEDYGARHSGDGKEGRLVTAHSFDSSWDVWEMHPVGSEVVMCLAGEITLVQEIDGSPETITLAAGEYAINAPGVWHTADADAPCTALFITAGEGTQHRPR